MNFTAAYFLIPSTDWFLRLDWWDERRGNRFHKCHVCVLLFFSSWVLRIFTRTFRGNTQSLLCMCACVSVFFYGPFCWQYAGVALQQQNRLARTHTHKRCIVCRLWNHCAELLFSLNLDHPIRTVAELWLTVMNARPLPSALLARAEHAGSILTNTPALH